MAGISDTIRQFQAAGRGKLTGRTGDAHRRLEPLSAFGSNPGALEGWHYLPPISAPMALVVVLHGCTQTAAAYDEGSGWSDLADRFGFAVLFPEQRRANNANLCFNWFLKEDTARDLGEAQSIRQMIEAMTKRYTIDTDRVFVTGLSAGGAMANVMLATYPEVFAAGSIIAGLPYGSATSVADALTVMRGGGRMSATAGAEAIRRASSHTGRWPGISVWHGDADRTVDVSNAAAMVDQWRSLHGAADASETAEIVDGQRHRSWRGQAGDIVVEEYRIAGVGHGTPLKTSGADSCGKAGAYMLEAGISSTWRQAASWGLLGRPRTVTAVPTTPTIAAEPISTNFGTIAVDANATIERALRAAGLMR